jgi:hypothetical protein
MVNFKRQNRMGRLWRFMSVSTSGPGPGFSLGDGNSSRQRAVNQVSSDQLGLAAAGVGNALLCLGEAPMHD